MPDLILDVSNPVHGALVSCNELFHGSCKNHPSDAFVELHVTFPGASEPVIFHAAWGKDGAWSASCMGLPETGAEHAVLWVFVCQKSRRKGRRIVIASERLSFRVRNTAASNAAQQAG
jgi:hypothetical protein